MTDLGYFHFLCCGNTDFLRAAELYFISRVPQLDLSFSILAVIWGQGKFIFPNAVHNQNVHFSYIHIFLNLKYYETRFKY